MFAAVCPPVPTSCSQQQIYESGCYAIPIIHDELRYASSLIVAPAEYHDYLFLRTKSWFGISCPYISTRTHDSRYCEIYNSACAIIFSSVFWEVYLWWVSSNPQISLSQQPGGQRRQVRKCDYFVVVVVALYAASNWPDYFQLLVLFSRSIPSFILFWSIIYISLGHTCTCLG